MTREEEIMKAARVYANGIAQHLPNKKYCEEDFIAGAKWADAHPHWISVEDKLPMEYEPVLAAFGSHYARVCFYSGGKWYIDAGVISDEVFGVSHWMQISPPPSSSEKPNNCEKGGEE